MTNPQTPSTANAFADLKNTLIGCVGVYLFGYYGLELLSHLDNSVAAGENSIWVAAGIGMLVYAWRNSKPASESTDQAQPSA